MVFCRLPAIFLSCLYLYHISFCKFILFILIFFFSNMMILRNKVSRSSSKYGGETCPRTFSKKSNLKFHTVYFYCVWNLFEFRYSSILPKIGEGLYLENSQFLRFLQGNNLHHQAENSQRFSYKSMSKFIFKFKICQ